MLRGGESDSLPQDYEPCVQPLHFPASDIVAYNCFMWFVYILLCEDGSLYTGVSSNLKKRFLDHKNGKGGRYTRSHKPIKIVYKEKRLTYSEALKRESGIKSWSREKKMKLCQQRDDGGGSGQSHCNHN